jgi:flagellar hook assembly protein FlgD
MKTSVALKLMMLTISLLFISWGAPRCVALAQLPQQLAVSVTNYPNPFDSRSERTTILFSLAQESQVYVAIYDLLGNLVRQFPSMIEEAGTTSIVWDGTNEAREKVAKGGYLVLIVANSESGTVQAIRKVGVLH